MTLRNLSLVVLAAVLAAGRRTDSDGHSSAAAARRRLKTIAMTSTFRERLQKARAGKAKAGEATAKRLHKKALALTRCAADDQTCDQAHPISGAQLQKTYGVLGADAWQAWVDTLPAVRNARAAESKLASEKAQKKGCATCKTDCVVTPFGAYGKCSQPCDSGFRASRRTVLAQPTNGGKACPAHLVLRQPCNTQPCATLSQRAKVEHAREARLRKLELGVMWKKYHEKVQIDCAVGHWSRYGQCSVPCGGGTKERRRQVLRVPLYQGRLCPTLSQTKQCNLMKCSAAQKAQMKAAAEKASKSKALEARVTKVARERLQKRMTQKQKAAKAAEKAAKNTASPTTAPTPPPTPNPTPMPTPYGRTMTQDQPANWGTMKPYERQAWITRWHVVHNVARRNAAHAHLNKWNANKRLDVRQLMICKTEHASWCPDDVGKAIKEELKRLQHQVASMNPVFDHTATATPKAKPRVALPPWACAALSTEGTCVCPGGVVVLQAPSGAQSEPFVLASAAARRLFFGSASGSDEHTAAVAVRASAPPKSVPCSLDAFDDPTDGSEPPAHLFCRCCEPHGEGVHAQAHGSCTALRVGQDGKGLSAPPTTTTTTTTTTTAAAAAAAVAGGAAAASAKKAAAAASHGTAKKKNEDDTELPKWACAAEGEVCSCSGHVLMGTGQVWLAPVPTRAQVRCGDKRYFSGSPAPGEKLYCMCKTLCKAKGQWVPCSTPPPHVKTAAERAADDAAEKAQKIAVLRQKIAAAKLKRKSAAENKAKVDAENKITAEHRQKKIAKRGSSGAHLALSAAEALRYPGAFDDDWSSEKADDTPAPAPLTGVLPPCAQGDADNIDDIESDLCPNGQVKSFANAKVDEAKIESQWEKAESHEEEKLVEVEEPVMWEPLKEPILRDTACPSAFTPPHFAQRLSLEAKQGCCLLDKVLGAVELLWHIRKCEHWHERVRDRKAVEKARAAGVMLPCEADAVGMFSTDLHSCCCDLPGEKGRTVASSSGDQCKHAQQCYFDGDDTGMWKALQGLQRDYVTCSQWHIDKGKGLALDEVGNAAHRHAMARCTALKKNVVSVTKTILAMSKALYKKVPEQLTEAAGNLLKLCNGKMWFGSCMPHINKLIKYQFHGAAAQNTEAPTPKPKMMTTADFNSAYDTDR